MPITSKANYSKAVFLKSVYRIGQLPDLGVPEIAFAGRSNVGKSSLINRLLNRKKLVKISSQPGKTQSINFYLVDEVLGLVDLPGYGYAKVSKEMRARWQTLITGYLEKRHELQVVVVIIDCRHPLKSQDRELIAWLRSRGIPFLPVYTKADKLSGNKRRQQALGLDASLDIDTDSSILFSAKTGYGRDKLIEALDRLVF